MASTVCRECSATIETDAPLFPFCKSDCQDDYDRRRRRGNSSGGGTDTGGTSSHASRERRPGRAYGF